MIDCIDIELVDQDMVSYRGVTLLDALNGFVTVGVHHPEDGIIRESYPHRRIKFIRVYQEDMAAVSANEDNQPMSANKDIP